MRRLMEDGLCLLLLLIAAGAACWPYLNSGDLPLDLEGVFFLPPWEAARTDEIEPPASPASAHHADQYYPWFAFLHDSVERGDSLLWYPLEGLGMPFFALWRTRVLSPFSVPFYLTDLHTAFTLSVFFKLLVAGIAAYYMTRRFGAQPAVALAAAGAFQLCGPVYVWSASPMADVVPWLPLLLLFGERLVVGHAHAWPLGALGIGVMALGGDPRALAVCLLLVAAYVIARRLIDWDPQRFVGVLARYTGAVALGLAVAAVQIVPYLEFVRHAGDLGETAPARVGAAGLTALFAPGALEGTAANPRLAGLLHVGIAPLLLLPLWVAVRRYMDVALRRRVEVFALGAVVFVALLQAGGALLDRSPLLGHLQTEHYFIGLGLAFGLLAAYAAEEWIALDADQAKGALKRLVFMLPIWWAAVFAAVAVSETRYSGAFSAGFWVVPVGIALAVLVLLAVTLLRPRLRLLCYPLAVLIVSGLLWAYRPVLPRTPEANVFPETPFVRSLDEMDARIGGSEALRQWPLAGHGIPQVYTPGGIALARFQGFADRAAEHPLLLRRSGAGALVLTKEDIQGPFAPVRPVLHINKVFESGAVLFRDLEARSRARMIYAGRPMQQFQPHLLSAAEPPLIEGATLPPEDDGPRAAAEIAKPEDNTKITVRVEETRPGALVLADAWYPGWRAMVDGASKQTFPVDGVFRGVELGAGEHEVTFTYRPRSLKVGAGISFAAVLVVLFGLRHVLPVWRRQ